MAGEWCLFPLFCGPVYFEETRYYRMRTEDSYCARYERVILDERELRSIRGLPRRVREKIQYNELDFACNCMGYRSPECRRVSVRYDGTRRRRA